MTASNKAKIGKVKAENVVVGAQHIVNHYHAQGGVEKDPARLRAQIEGYLKWVVGRYGTIELRGIERAGGAPVVVLPLDTAYVPLEATVTVQRSDRSFDAIVKKARRPFGDSRAESVPHAETFDVNLQDVAGLGHRLVIVGGPGSGKTTVLLHMAWALAVSLLDPASTAAATRLGLTGELPLPIFVPLSSFNHHWRNLPAGAPPEHGTLSHFISHHLIASDAGVSLPQDFFSRLLEVGRGVMLLLDGLDEVANEDQRALVTEAVQSLTAGKDGLRVVVTCRTAAYTSPGTPLGGDFRHIKVKPLDLETHVTSLVRRAHSCIYPHDPGEAKRRSDNLLGEIEKLEAARRAARSDAEPLVNSPLMVRLLLIVDYNERTLPDERAKLFEKAVDALIRVDYAHSAAVGQFLAGNWETRRDMLQQLAFHMHGRGEAQGREIDEAALKRALKADPEFVPHIKDLIEHTRNRGGLLEERDGNYRFIHLAFQEFLTARYLREVMGGEGLDAVVAFLSGDKLVDPWWREPILMLAGYMGANSAANARVFLRKLSQSGLNADARLAGAELAGTGAVEWRDSGEALRADLAARVAALYAEQATMSAAKPVLRARAGRALARLGDPRGYVTQVDKMRLCWIPAGRFYMGSPVADKESFEDERPPAPDYLVAEDFAIGEHPVTWAQYAQFAAKGYLQAEWWTAAIAAGCWANGHVTRQVLYSNDPEKTGQPGQYRLETERETGPHDYGEPYRLSNHPVVGVSWYEALAFCAWLEQRWRAVGWLRAGHRVRLPSEPEWEKAARGGDRLPAEDPVVFTADRAPTQHECAALFESAPVVARLFPYGETASTERSNIDATGLESTSPAGCFPNGASPYGCQDMSGNVLEWTRSAWGPWTFRDGDYEVQLAFGYPYAMNDGREGSAGDRQMARALRGGSFVNYDWNARCAHRSRYLPDRRFFSVGFRVVVSPAFSSL